VRGSRNSHCGYSSVVTALEAVKELGMDLGLRTELVNMQLYVKYLNIRRICSLAAGGFCGRGMLVPMCCQL
jgi:hypothetical protein